MTDPMTTQFRSLNFRHLLIILLCCLGVEHLAHASPQIELIGNEPNRFIRAGQRVDVHDLGALGALEKEISVNLPHHEANARALVGGRISGAFVARLNRAWLGHLLVQRYQIQFLPAILINRSSVYYGYDVNRAVQLWTEQEHKRGKQQ